MKKVALSSLLLAPELLALFVVISSCGLVLRIKLPLPNVDTSVAWTVLIVAACIVVAYLFAVREALCIDGHRYKALACGWTVTAITTGTVILFGLSAPAFAWDALHFWLQRSVFILTGPGGCNPNEFWFWCDKHSLLTPVIASNRLLAVNDEPHAQLIWASIWVCTNLVLIREAVAYFNARTLIALSIALPYSVPLLEAHAMAFGYAELLVSYFTLVAVVWISKAIVSKSFAAAIVAIFFAFLAALAKNSGILVLLFTSMAFFWLVWQSIFTERKLGDISFALVEKTLLAGIIFLVLSVYLYSYGWDRALHNLGGKIWGDRLLYAGEAVYHSLLINQSFGIIWIVLPLSIFVTLTQNGNAERHLRRFTELKIAAAFLAVGIAITCCYLILRPYFLSHAMPGHDTSFSRVIMVFTPVAVLAYIKLVPFAQR